VNLSKLHCPNGDDHPDAAGKHLEDAKTLENAGRYDGAAYLSGYVVECCLKSLVLFESHKRTWNAHTGHDLRFLSSEALRLAALPSSKTAKYAPRITPGHSLYDNTIGWHEYIRYHASGSIAATEAKAWLSEAEAVYTSVVTEMRLDGVL
jgi:hypothetical protein